MKTLKSLTLVVLFAFLASATYANTYYETRYEVKTSKDLPSLIKQMVKTDFVRFNNYFQQNNIDKLNESVTFEFFIDKQNQIQIIKVESDNADASAYVKQLLDDKKISADESVVNKKYKLVLKLYYRS
ncbi:MAG: hypothetical protein ACERKD_11465 [Prolixibacteraceae bacterium]